MNFMPMVKLGPHAAGSQIHFGILLPGITPRAGYRLEVRIIHERDQFIQSEPPCRQSLNHLQDPDYGDYWETTVDLSGPGAGGHWGQEGCYIYRYAAFRPDNREIDWIIDPFARQFGTGRHAAFTYPFDPYAWSDQESSWLTPAHHDLVLYELNIMEFAGSLPAAAERFDYLQDLGINCLSLMPVTNISDAVDWGYTPIGYFGVDERFGKRNDFQAFVDQAHQHGIAVLVDAIYGHCGSLFGYEYLYRRLAGIPNPMMGSFSKDMFAPSVDWTKGFAQDFFYTVNRHWLEAYHIDGFRYDCVPNYWELAPDFRGYASIAYHTHQWVKAQIAGGNPRYARFAAPGQPLRLIQCAEQLEAVREVLEQTFSTCTWQEGTLSAAARVARNEAGALAQLGLAWGATDLPTEKAVNADRLFKSPLQYIENHDKDRFICHFGIVNPDQEENPLFEQGDRSNWFKVQPYFIGLFMSKGLPLLWQGQELLEGSKVAAGGMSRTGFLRMVQWEHFYDAEGRATLRLVRSLIRIRKKLPHVRNGEHFFFNDDGRYHQKGVLLFARYYASRPDHYSLTALNFTDHDQRVPFWFPLAGDYEEELHGAADSRHNLTGVPAYQEVALMVPSNYGRIWTHVG